MGDMKAPDHRQAQTVAALGFVAQLVCLGTLIGLAIWSKSDSIAALARLAALGVPIWFVLFLIFKQLRRVASEQLESAELKQAAAAGAAENIFDIEDEALLIEQNRLRWMLKWILPAITVVLFLYLLIGQFVGWGWKFDQALGADGVGATQHPMRMFGFVASIGLICFGYARWSIELARVPQWRLLRAGSICMAGVAAACLLLAIALMAGRSFPWAEPVFAIIARGTLIILGFELAANFILDFYRPNVAGILPRPSFESRLLSLLAEPGGIAKSIADAMNYQFGFEVSTTWFYQLLQRWLFPITVFTFFVILMLSSVVIVNADEQAVIERFGRIVEKPTVVLEPGLHFKWPYPIDVVRRAPSRRIRELVIGEATENDGHDPKKAILWTEAHDYVPELMLLVGAPRAESATDWVRRGLPGAATATRTSESVPVALLMVSVPIEYRVKDIRAYLYNYSDPEKIMEAVAYQFLSDYAAGVDMNTLMGPGREDLNKQLRTTLQQKLDEYNTGIEIVFAGVVGAHPPAKNGVAEAFLSVINAQTKKGATINAAEGEARRILTTVAGTETRALELDEAIRARDKLQSDPKATPEERTAAAVLVENLLSGSAEQGIPPLSGDAAALIAEAEAGASDVLSDAASKVRAFRTDLVAYNSAPQLYKQRKWMEIWEGLESVRKYLIVGDSRNVIIEYETEAKGGLDEVLKDDGGS